MFCYGCNNSDEKIENIKTFSKVYGYVRWFYPGDEISSLDWNRFAVYGVQKVEKARSQKELKQIMQNLFKPIAPALIIDDAKLNGKFDRKLVIPNDSFGCKPVFWLHHGVYLGEKSNIYSSLRINRDSNMRNNICFLNILEDVTKYCGKEVRMTVSIKSAKQGSGNAYLYLTSYKNAGTDFTDVISRERCNVQSNDQWRKFECIKKVNQSDTFIAYGIGTDNSSSLNIAGIKLMYKEGDEWKSTKLTGPQAVKGFLYEIITDSTEKINGDYITKIIPKYTGIKIGNSIKKNIGHNMECIMPLTLYANKEHTFPVSDAESLKQLKNQLSQIPDSALNTKHIEVRLANVVIAWNVFQHFYPYFDVVHVDWDKEFSPTINMVYNGFSEPDYFKTLSKMVSKLEDGHGVVSNNKIIQWGLPVSFAWIENKVVIKASNSPLFHRGDIIEKIDGKIAIEELLEQESNVSGSSQLKRYRALNMFGSDFSKSEATVTLYRDHEKIEIKANREYQSNLFYNPIGMGELKSADYGNGIYYENSPMTDFGKELENMTNAKGIIVSSLFDLSKIIPHIIHESVWSPIWNIPVVTYPDRESISFDNNRWKIEPQKPFIHAKFAFIEEPNVVSSGETFLSFVDYNNLGKLIGDTTAGTNGNVNFIPLMGGYSIMWTGMRVLKQDGSQHHLIGYVPDYPVYRTIQATKAGKDEYLEKAIEVLIKEIAKP